MVDFREELVELDMKNKYKGYRIDSGPVTFNESTMRDLGLASHHAKQEFLLNITSHI